MLNPELLSELRHRAREERKNKREPLPYYFIVLNKRGYLVPAPTDTDKGNGWAYEVTKIYTNPPQCRRGRRGIQR